MRFYPKGFWKPIDLSLFLIYFTAFLSILSWMFSRDIFLLGSAYKPMAVSTAIILILLTSSIMVFLKKANNRLYRLYVYISLIITTLVSSEVMLKYWLGLQLDWEGYIVSNHDIIGNVASWKMSEMTAPVLLAIAIAVFFIYPPWKTRRWSRQVSATLSSLTLITSLFMFISYLSGVNLFIGNLTTQMAILTSIVLSLLSINLIVLAGHDVYPLSFLLRQDDKVDRNSFWGNTAVLVFILFAIAVISAGTIYIKQQVNNYTTSRERELSAIADLKAEQISRWYKERAGDAQLIFAGYHAQRESYNLITRNSLNHDMKRIESWLYSIKNYYNYSACNLYDSSGKLITGTDKNADNRYPFNNNIFKLALTTKKTCFSDIHSYKSKDGKKQMHLGFWIPVINPAAPDSPAVGVWLMQINPYQYLFPMVQSWPTFSRTAETLIVEKQDNYVYFLNSLRHVDAPPLSIRSLISNNYQLPAVKAVQGFEGITVGIDYRGVPVLSAIRKIDNTPWFMVAKIDRKEIIEPLTKQAMSVGLILLILLVTVAITIGYLEKRLFLEKSESVAREWKSTFDSVNDVIWLLDKDFRIMRSNDASRTILNKNPEEIIGQHCWKVVHGTEKQIAECPVLTMLETKHRSSVELQINDAWYNVTVDPIFDESGVLKGTVHIIRDVTERRKAEQEKEESEYRYRELFENMSSGVTIYKPINDGDDFIITDMNKSGENLTGTLRDNIVGKSVKEVFPGITEMGLFTVFQQVYKTGKPQNHPTTHYSDGKLNSWFENYVYQLNSTEIIAIYDDVTQRMQAEEEREFLAKLLEQSSQPFAVIYPGGKIDRCNRAFRQMVGYSESEYTGNLNTNELTPQEWVEIENNNVNSLVETGIPVRFEKEYIRKDGTRVPVEIFLHVVKKADGKVDYYYSFARDITASKQAAAEIARINESLEQRVAERTAQLETVNKELEAFSYSVSHDLRAPLRILDGWSLALIEDYADKIDDEGKHLLSRLRFETQHMGHLIDALLQLSRTSKAEVSVKEINLSEIAETIIARLESDSPERSVDIKIQTGLKCMGDYHLMDAVMTNLLDNAWKFTSKVLKATIEFGSVMIDDHLTYFVKDNGAGFNMAYSDKLFGTFQRLHKPSEFEGTGIGLANVKRIIARHGGKVWADSEVNIGSTFYFTI